MTKEYETRVPCGYHDMVQSVTYDSSTALLSTGHCLPPGLPLPDRNRMVYMDICNILPSIDTHCIISIPTNELGVDDDRRLAFPDHAAIERVRLVDCQALCGQDTLRIFDFARFPSLEAVPYAAVSYPWRGIAVDQSKDENDQIFAVRGAEDADPVGIDALRHVCAAALAQGCMYVWLDRLCIMQTSREDKNWQIRHMYQMYRSCRLCLVLAGGLRRLVRLDEETSWIHRSWTLQEVLAPPKSIVLFDWKLGCGSVDAEHSNAVDLEEAIEGKSAMAPISLVLAASAAGTMTFRPASHPSDSFLVEVTIFSAHPASVRHSYNDAPLWRPQRKILAPNVSALSMAMDPALMSDPDTRAHAVWKSALMRTSSRPVDMVFSIMGLFGVVLDPARFEKNDRHGATIALAKEILKAGGSASWLGVGFRVEPDRTLSMFPTLPRTSVSGTALIETNDHRTLEISEFIDPVYPVSEALVPFPKGDLDNDGRLTFMAKSTPIRSIRPEDDGAVDVFSALDGSTWIPEQSDGNPDKFPRTYAALLGWFNRYYPGMTSAHDNDTIRAMLIEEHAPDQYHIRTFFALHRSLRATVLGWVEREFCVGGRNEYSRNLSSHSLEGATSAYPEDEKPWPRIPTSKPITTVEDMLIRKARWAVPQEALERQQE